MGNNLLEQSDPAGDEEPLADLLSQISQLKTTLTEFQTSLAAARGSQLRRTALAGTSGLVEKLALLQQSTDSTEKRLRQRAREQEHLYALQEVTSAINSSLDLEVVLQQVMDAIIQLTEAERALLLLFDPGGELEVRVGRNLDRETLDNAASAEISRSVVRHVATTGEPVLMLDAQEDDRFATQESIVGYGLRSILCVPLRIRGEIIGVIYADNRVAGGTFQENDRDALLAFADQAALAIYNARLFLEVTEVNDLMDNVFASIAGGVITIDSNDHIAIFNQAAEQLFDCSATETLGQHYSEVLNRLNISIHELVEKVKQNGESQEVEIDWHGKETISTLLVTLTPLADDTKGAPGGVAVVIDDRTEAKRVESLRRYLPSTLVDQVRDIDAAQRPQRREITILFADIRSFSTIGEDLEPEDLIRLANSFFTEAVGAIRQYDGLIDKFVGDAVMALFNTPLNPQVDHAEQAVRAALLIRDNVARLKDSVSEIPAIHFGIGIHSGVAVVGNVGSSERKDYSAIGDAVNLAKRLQEMTGLDEILMSQDVQVAVVEWVESSSLPAMQVKGRQKSENVFRLEGRR